MIRFESIFFSGGSIGGQTGKSGGSIGGQTGKSGGSIPGKSINNNNDACIVVKSLKKGEIIYADILRLWRDNCLMNSNVGKMFVDSYYLISPRLVKLSNKLPIINKIVRNVAIFMAKKVAY